MDADATSVEINEYNADGGFKCSPAGRRVWNEATDLKSLADGLRWALPRWFGWGR